MRICSKLPRRAKERVGSPLVTENRSFKSAGCQTVVAGG